jgi:hypothetical protein
VVCSWFVAAVAVLGIYLWCWRQWRWGWRLLAAGDPHNKITILVTFESMNKSTGAFLLTK